MKPFLEIGRIVGVHGLRGEVRVQPWCDSPEFLLAFSTLYFEEGQRPVRVERSRVQKNIVLAKLEGVNDVDTANTYRGKILYMARADVKLAPGTYFIQDLIGLQVVDADDPTRCYGVLEEVSPTGANDVYHVRSGDRVTLIPAIPQVIEETNLAEGILRIRPMKGLFDDAD